MAGQCPRCGMPDRGDYPLCQGCGFDLRVASQSATPQAQFPQSQSPFGAPQQYSVSTGPVPQSYEGWAPPQQTAPPPQATSSVCPRCNAQLYPGFTQCSRCGYDARAAWGMPVPFVQPRRSMLPYGLIVAGVALLVAAGAIFVVAQPGNGSAPSPSAVAAALPTPTPTPTPTPSPTPAAPSPSPSLAATASPTSGATYSDTAWITYSPKDAGFVAKFPAQPKLTKQTQSTSGGDVPVSLWTYVESSHLALAVLVATYPAGVLTGIGPAAAYDGALAGVTGSTSGLTLASQGDVILDGHSGRSFTCDGPTYSLMGQMFLVGSSLYMVYSAYDSTVSDTAEVAAFIADFQLTV